MLLLRKPTAGPSVLSMGRVTSFVLGMLVASTASLAFTITSPPPVTPPPVVATPKSVTLTPATASLPDNTAAGAVLASVGVTMSDNSTFSGTLAVPKNDMVGVSSGKLTLTRALAAADDGVHNFVVTATQGGASANATFAFTVTATAPATVSADGTKSAAPSGVALVTKDGKWTWGVAEPSRPGEYDSVLNGGANGIGSLMEVAKGGQLYVATASGYWFVWNNGAWSNSTDPNVVPLPVITVTPSAPRIAPAAPLGSTVATYAVTMDDGSPFVGTIGFGLPNMDAGGIFALTGQPTSGKIIVKSNGPGVGTAMVTDRITLLATQP